MKNLLVICDIPDANLFFTSVNSDTLPLLYSKDALLDVLVENTFERIGIAFEKKELFDVDFRLFNVKHIDFLACDTLNDPVWRNYYKTLQDAGITVGASDNQTGNLKYGGDWVMESTSQDIEKVYFSEGIEYYKYLLDPSSNHMFVMKSSGLYGSGLNTNSQLGGAGNRVATGFTGATAVSCGGSHTVAIKDGILYGCGLSDFGQLGSAGSTGTLTPMGLTGCTAVSCGGSYTVAIKDGILYGCGTNSKGQLGSAVPIGGSTGTLTPMGLTGCTAVSCGLYHTLAISNGILYGCGRNNYGQIGSAVINNGNTGTLTPMGLTGCTAVSCGVYHTVAISNGILYGCGFGGFGQLGSAVINNGNTGTLTPMGLTGCTAVSCGFFHTTAIKDGILYGCGNGDYGRLGSAGTTGTLTPISELTGFTKVSCGDTYTVAIKDENLYGSGRNANKLLGDTGIAQYNSFTLLDSNVLNINDSGKFTTYLQLTTTYINKPITLTATSNSPSMITFSSSSTLISVIGGIATPLKTGTGTIVVTQGATGNFLSATVTGSVQVYVTNLGFTGLPSMINKETKLSVISDSPGSISYTSNSILSVTGSGTNFTVTPLQTGTGTIVVYQGATGNFLGATVTGSVQVYYNNLGFTGFPSFINKETTLSVTSDSTGAIHYSSSNPLVLSVTGTGKSCRVTPLQIGNVSIIVNQDANYPYSSATVTGSVKVYWNINIEKIFDSSLYLSNGILYDDSTLISTDIGIIYANVIDNTYYYLNKEGNLYTIKCIKNSVKILFTSYIEIKTFRVVDSIIYICLIDGLYTFNINDNRIRQINNLNISATTVKMYITKKGSHVDIYIQCGDKLYIFNNDTYCVYNNNNIISQSYGATGLTGPICTELTNRNSNNEYFLLTNIISGDDVSIKNPNWYYEDYDIENDKKITADNNITLQGNDKIYYNLKCNFVSKEITGETGSMVFLYGNILP